MKQLIRNSILSSLGKFKSIANGIHILNSHYIARNDLPKEVFHDLLNMISKQADFIRIEDAVSAIKNKTHRNEKLIAFTFDDGFEECYTKIAPVLSDFNTNAAFFINPGFIDGDENYRKNFTDNIIHVNKKPMTWKMIKELHQQNFVIGNHTLDHVRLVGLNTNELQQQISKAKNRIEEQINAPCDYFAWTYGKNSDIDEKALNYCLKQHQYVFGGDNFTKYYSFNNSVFNRRHIEGDWPISHIHYFLSKKKSY
jgi:peptidoglycan/xylan/chitin deacetylase (PgdA/CDA1 family)